MKKYTVYWKDREYYGINAHWATYYDSDRYYEDNIEINREFLIKSLKDLLRYDDDYQTKFLPIGEFMDFIDTLSNNLNGEELYENFCLNLEFVNEIDVKSFEKNDDFRKTYKNIVYPDEGYYDEGCSLKLFNDNINYLLKEHSQFKEWFEAKLRDENKYIWSILFDSEENAKETIRYYKSQIKNNESNIKYFESQIKLLKQRNKNMNKEIEQIKNDFNFI